MRDGSLKLKFEAGQVVAVSVNAGLDVVYQRLFDSARSELQKPEPSIDAGIHLIIFGCFWLEAVCNETLRELIRASTKPVAAGDAAWESLKRTSFHSKLSIISAYNKTPDPNRSGSIADDLTGLFDLRNRLAHFKDEDTVVSGPLTAEDLHVTLEHFPDAELIGQLRPPSTEKWAKKILSGIAWSTEIHQQYFPSKTLSVEELSAGTEDR